MSPLRETQESVQEGGYEIQHCYTIGVVTMSNTRTHKTRSGNGHRLERRKNVRLRNLVDEFKAGISKNRGELQLQLTRIAQIQVELDQLKRAGSKG